MEINLSVDVLPVVPLSLDEGSNPESDKHSMFLNELNKLHQVIITSKVELHIEGKTFSEHPFEFCGNKIIERRGMKYFTCPCWGS